MKDKIYSNKFRILLVISLIRSDYPPSNLPHGVLSLASVLREEGHIVIIYDANAVQHNEDILKYHTDDSGKVSWSLLRGVVALFKPDIIGISGLITTYKWQKEAIRQIKEAKPDAYIIAGGGCATTVPHLMNQLADTMIIGAGEEIFLNLLEMEDRKKLDIMTGSAPDINTLPLPAWDLIDMETYLKNPFWGANTGNSTGTYTFTHYIKDRGLPYERTIDLLASRGCPFKCRYCAKLCSYQQRSVDNVFQEILLLKTLYKPDFYGFVDDNMMSNERWLISFCAKLIDYAVLPPHVDIIWGCQGRVNNASPAMLGLMHNAGCRFIAYGIEKFSQPILDSMNKKITVEQSIKAILNTRKAGIYAHTFFMFGYPGETKKTINESIRIKKELGIDVPAFWTTPYPGTELFRQFEKKIYQKFGGLENYVCQLEELNKFIINLTEFSDNEILKMKEKDDLNIEV